MKVPAAGQGQKFAVFGALDYASGRLTHRTSPTKDGAACATSLDHPGARPPDDGPPTIGALDTVSYHTGHEPREHWQRLSARLRPLWPPAYAPPLHPIERVWGYLEGEIGRHRRWNDLDRLMRACDTLLASLTVHFHADDGPAFRLVSDLRKSA